MVARCKDCLPAKPTRPAPHPGPRCATHHRQRRKLTAVSRWEKHIRETYNLLPYRFWELYRYQGSRCAICRRATGASRKLSVDHDHACCPGPRSCGECVRGLLCRPCNKILGHFRDDPQLAHNAADYLTNPPAKEVLR